MSEVKCTCGKVIYGQSSGKWFMWLSYGVSLEVNYCHSCGDKLNADGTLESRAEVEWKAKLFEDMFDAEDYIEKCDTCKNIDDEDKCNTCSYYSNYEEAAE